MSMYIMLGIATMFAIVGALLSLTVLVAAFRSSNTEGLLSLFVPGYALYFAFVKWEAPRHILVGASLLASFAIAGVCATFSTAFEPAVAIDVSFAVDPP